MDDLSTITGRIGRAMPRNADVMALCDALDVTLRKRTPETLQPNVTLHCPACAERRRRGLERVRRYRQKSLNG
jgi:hypothetical protein